MDLHLNVKKVYFNKILSGEKPEEYREYNDYWKKRLVGRKYQKVIIKLGYPPKNDRKKYIEKAYRGYVIKNIYHPHFNNGDCTKVFAIDVR